MLLSMPSTRRSRSAADASREANGAVAPIRSQRVKLIRKCSAIKNVAANPRDREVGELSVKFDSSQPLPLSDKERKYLQLIRRFRVPFSVTCYLFHVHLRPKGLSWQVPCGSLVILLRAQTFREFQPTGRLCPFSTREM
jgi:hypothetical protein